MERFKNILFVADNSKGESAALAKVLQLARVNKASVCILDVMEDYPDIRFMRAGLEDMGRVHRDLKTARTADLKQLLALVKSAEARVKTKILIREGKQDIEIIRQVLENDHDLVVKVSSGHPKLNGMRLGTLDMSLLRKCPCPVLIMKPRRRIKHSRILAAVDLTLLVDDPLNLDRTILDLAGVLTKLEQGNLHILHAWNLPYERLIKGEARARFYKSVPQMRKSLRKVEKQHLDDIARLYSDFSPTVHMLKGLPEEVIPQFANTHDIDLIVMGTLARAGVEGLLIGNTAEKILSKIDCSVLAMKPAGFVSPVSV